MITNKSLIIAKREFLSVIKQKMFIIITFGIPLFFVFIGFLSLFHSYFIANDLTQSIKSIGIVDEANVIGNKNFKDLLNPDIFGSAISKGDQSALRPLVKKFIADMKVYRYDKIETGIKDVKIGRVTILYTIPKDYLKTGVVKSYSRKAKIFSGGDYFLRWALRNALLIDTVDNTIVNRIQDPVSLRHNLVNEKGEIVEENELKFWGSLLIPYIASGIMMLTIFIPSSYLLQSVSEEKESRIIEVLLSSVSSEELLLGKMIGLGAAGLIQASIWLLFIAVPFSMGTVFFEISALHILLYFMYIILGFLLYGTIMAGIGSMGYDSKQAAQLAGICSGVSVIPLLFMPIIVLQPNGVISRVMSYFPFTSSVTMMVRLSTNKLDMSDIIITLLILIPTIYFVIKIITKVFRVGLLMYGKRLTVREYLKWLKSS